MHEPDTTDEETGGAEAPDRIVIREATTRDFSALCDLFEEVDRLHREHLPDLFRKPRGAPREATQINHLIQSPDAALFVASTPSGAGTHLVGLVLVVIYSAPSYPILVPLRYAMVDTLVVAESARGQGIGRALMAKAEAWARAKQLSRIEINVFEFNEQAIDFYDGLGYTTLSRRMVKRLDA